ncbi:MAG: proline--tRNA ligase, partial [Planctomycetes bacterium]|nr:proline--tRNA ligase [Planctomycetota bacterium]
HEFQVLAQAGEDVIFYSDESDYAANLEMASSITPEKEQMTAPGPCSLIDTPKQKTIEAVSLALNLPASRLLKTLVVEGHESPAVALILKGDDELNEIKTIKHPWIKQPLRFIPEDELKEKYDLCPGFMGPIDLKIPCIIDQSAWSLAWFACGANQFDKHLVNADWNSIKHPELFDLRNVKVGDKSPDGQGHLQSCRGIEVGHVFQLGQKYSESMKLQVLDESGKPQTVYMGCYGLGVSRLVAAAIEQHHDDKGIIWPQAIAPFDVVIIPINHKQSADVLQTTEKLYQDLQDAGFDVLLDDRKERPGVMFADHDLIGIPHRIVIGEKSLANGEVEYKHRQ